MTNLRRVVWTKGMFLTPQHFQAHDNYVEDTLQFRFAASQFANWGVTDLAVEEHALVNGQFVLSRCRAVLPDGTPVNCPEVDALPGRRPFAALFPAAQDALDVYLAIPERRTQGQNVLPANGQGNGAAAVNIRYTAAMRQVRDENGADEDKPVLFADKNLQILFGGQPLDGFVRLRIARVVRTATGTYALDNEFVPACLDIAASAYLLSLLQRQIEILGTKSQTLAGARRERGKSLADFNASETASFWLLHTVNSCIPELNHIWKVRRSHPEPLYVSLLRLAGALSTFSLEADPRALPDYNHDDLGGCFTALDAEIRELLETVIPTKCIAIPLKKTDRVWSGQITDDEWLRTAQFFLAISRGESQLGVEDIIRKIDLVRVASTDDIQNLVSFSLLGVGLKHQPPPPGASFRIDTQYFSLNQSGRLWDAIVRSRAVSVYIPKDIGGVRPELLAVLP